MTGLIVQDTATYFTPFGQAIILILFQLGGLGIMTFSTLILLVAGKKISIKDRIIIQQGFHSAAPKDVKILIKNIFFYALRLLGLSFSVGRMNFPGLKLSLIQFFIPSRPFVMLVFPFLAAVSSLTEMMP